MTIKTYSEYERRRVRRYVALTGGGGNEEHRSEKGSG